MHFSRSRKWTLLALYIGSLAAAFAEPVGATPAAPARPPLLNDAFNAFIEHQGRWAFTESHHGIGPSGKPMGETIIRVDPSRPYTEQFVPVKLGGKPPSADQLRQFATRGERAAKRRQESIEETKSAEHRNDEVQLYLNGQKVIPELEHATILSEDDQSVTYEIPLRKAGSGNEARFDKYQLTAQVSRQRHEFMRALIRQRSSLRVNLLARVSEGVIEIEFGSPDPRYPSFPLKTTSRATIKILLGKPHLVQTEAVRTEMKHVTPYDERFGVKLGPMRTIEL